MSIFGKLFKSKRSEDQQDKRQITFNPVVIPDSVIPPEAQTVDSLTASTIACVKRCMEVKCGTIASLPLHAEHIREVNGRRYWEREDSVLDFLLSGVPNHRQSAYDFLWDIIYQREMKGDVYIVPVYRDGILAELIPIPRECSVSYSKILREYDITDEYDGIIGRYGEDEVIHLKSYSDDGFLGNPVTQLARVILSIAYKTYQQQSMLFTPGSTLRGFITGDDAGAVGFGGATDDQLEGVTNRIRNELSRGTNLGYLPGTMKFVPTSMTPADMQLNEAMKYLNLEVCRAIGVPPTQAFQDSNVNYKSSETSQTILMTSTVAPIIAQIESEFERKLLDRRSRKKMRIRFDTASYYQTDPTALYTSLSNLVSKGVITANDARERMGLGPVEGGDKLYIIGGKTNDTEPSSGTSADESGENK